ncbi:hypothetical protein K438DRAFT_2012077 [Mycena galopus ATCC 62051]|nr:hypothetical protein K438DRAFT_2012077 [Mycena galopus ATCC 62051]
MHIPHRPFLVTHTTVLVAHAIVAHALPTTLEASYPHIAALKAIHEFPLLRAKVVLMSPAMGHSPPQSYSSTAAARVVVGVAEAKGVGTVTRGHRQTRRGVAMQLWVVRWWNVRPMVALGGTNGCLTSVLHTNQFATALVGVDGS